MKLRHHKYVQTFWNSQKGQHLITTKSQWCINMNCIHDTGLSISGSLSYLLHFSQNSKTWTQNIHNYWLCYAQKIITSQVTNYPYLLTISVKNPYTAQKTYYAMKSVLHYISAVLKIKLLHQSWHKSGLLKASSFQEQNNWKICG